MALDKFFAENSIVEYMVSADETTPYAVIQTKII
jgi:hypothetical protein